MQQYLKLSESLAKKNEALRDLVQQQQQTIKPPIEKDKLDLLTKLTDANLLKFIKYFEDTSIKFIRFKIKNNQILYGYEKDVKDVKDVKDGNRKYFEISKMILTYNNLLDTYNKKELEYLNPIQNQINRIRDSRVGAAKMVLMHVVTGQEFKFPMVMETIGLTTTLFKSTNIDFKQEDK
jgi:hypothetical protein